MQALISFSIGAAGLFVYCWLTKQTVTWTGLKATSAWILGWRSFGRVLRFQRDFGVSQARPRTNLQPGRCRPNVCGIVTGTLQLASRPTAARQPWQAPRRNTYRHWRRADEAILATLASPVGDDHWSF